MLPRRGDKVESQPARVIEVTRPSRARAEEPLKTVPGRKLLLGHLPGRLQQDVCGQADKIQV